MTEPPFIKAGCNPASFPLSIGARPSSCPAPAARPFSRNLYRNGFSTSRLLPAHSGCLCSIKEKTLDLQADPVFSQRLGGLDIINQRVEPTMRLFGKRKPSELSYMLHRRAERTVGLPEPRPRVILSTPPETTAAWSFNGAPA